MVVGFGLFNPPRVMVGFRLFDPLSPAVIWRGVVVGCGFQV